jgi:AcrR family transcriptional regulator
MSVDQRELLTATEPDVDADARLRMLRAGAPRPLLSRSDEAQLGPRQQEVLVDLEELFVRRGFSSLTIADLAAGIGCSRRTLYELAPSKERLVLVVLDRFLHRKGRSALAAIDATEPIERQIRAYLGGGVTLVWERPLADDIADDAPARRLVDRHYRFVMTVVERLVSMGIEAGDFRPVNPAVAAATITGAALYIEEPDMADRLGVATAEVATQILDLVLPSLAIPDHPTRQER